jgi:hypothetical protein
MHSAASLESLLEAAAEIITGEMREQPRRRQRGGGSDDVHVARALAVAALVGIPLVEHLRRRLPPEPLEEPREQAHEQILPLRGREGQESGELEQKLLDGLAELLVELGA